ncbi:MULTISPECIES: sirohydrochlorin chelatase [unclassified Variovorax]|uniref:sirohydrochlorin chelatase n=1 Tax=unclassified Variovorax TaxID=663243 RepID=UPI001BD56A3E|nr:MULTISPECIES: CbiX/SirB N-terminal domain-containing protein [unclassified Variovorax]
MQARRGIVLFAHGSRDARWREPIEAVALRVAERHPEALVRCAYLELVAPDLTTAVAQLVGLGATSVRVVPLFLGIGKHLREDLPKLMAQCADTHREVIFTLQKAIGEESEVIDLLARIACPDG